MTPSTPMPDTMKGRDISYRKFATWVGLGGQKPSNLELADYLERELENREEVTEAVEAAVIREGIKALRAIDPMREAVEYADTRAVSRVAYPHAALEEKKLRDLIDRALSRAESTQ